MALDGVEVHGRLHRLRLYDAFYRRQSAVFQMVVTLAAGLIRQENQEAVIKQIRRLNEIMFPQDPEAREERERALKDVLRREGEKSYKVVKVNLGERRE